MTRVKARGISLTHRLLGDPCAILQATSRAINCYTAQVALHTATRLQADPPPHIGQRWVTDMAGLQHPGKHMHQQDTQSIPQASSPCPWMAQGYTPAIACVTC
jgi:hypothetical protein